MARQAGRRSRASGGRAAVGRGSAGGGGQGSISHGPAQVVRRPGDAPVVPAPHVLRDYALLADGIRGVLVGPQGDCGWLCFPGWDDPAVFASLVGSGGTYHIQPTGRWVWGGYYEDGTLIWRSRWVTEAGVFESRDALVYPGDPDRAVLLRRVSALEEDGQLVVALDPRADYGRSPLGPWRRRGECWEARGADMVVRWWGAPMPDPRRSTTTTASN